MAFIIAEIGINWDGDLNLAKEMIEKSKDAGANAVKFQAFNFDIVKNHPQNQRLMKSSISKENIEQIVNITKEEEIEFFCTPMYSEGVNLLEPYVNRYKIREIDGRELLKDRVSEIFDRILKTKKEVIISSNTSPKKSKFYNKDNIKWLYCVPKYPTKIEELDFSIMKDFDGYSNHTPEILIPIVASVLGSEIIEVHVTLDKKMDFIDNNVSLDFSDFKEMIRQIRIVEKLRKK